MSEVSLSNIRTEYSKASLDKSAVDKDPFSQFKKWFDEVVHSQIEESNAMTLATVGEDEMPSARIVLLKGLDEKGFYFYTNYESKKGRELEMNPQAALVFFWKELERQVRIQGSVVKAPSEESDQYYLSRPEGSQQGAWASPQSQPISSREVLKERLQKIQTKFKTRPLYRPPFWGGFLLMPRYFEFWQGRPSRLHDRIVYTPGASDSWEIKRLAP